MEEKKYYVAQASDNGVAYLGLKKGKRYILTPWGEDIWIVFMQGKTIGVGKTNCFEITSFELIKEPAFCIGDEVTIEVIIDDLSFKWIKGIIKEIDISSSNDYYYTIEDEDNKMHYYMWEDDIKLINDTSY